MLNVVCFIAVIVLLIGSIGGVIVSAFMIIAGGEYNHKKGDKDERRNQEQGN